MEIAKAFNAAYKDVDLLTIKHIGLRNISDTTKKEYLSRFTNKEDREFVEKVLNETIYVPEHVFLKELNDAFDKFSENIRDEPFYIYLPKAKFGSEQIFTIYLWNKIINKNFIKFVHAESDIDKNSNILIIDDCIYTGINTLSAIDETTYNNKNKVINFHLVIPYVSNLGKLEIETFSNRFKDESQLFSVKFYNTVNTVNFFSDPEDIKNEDFLRKFKLEGVFQVPIYFDHKVGNNFSTFDSIYLKGIVPGEEDYGLLINYIPDTDVKTRVYNKHFVGVDIFNY